MVGMCGVGGCGTVGPTQRKGRPVVEMGGDTRPAQREGRPMAGTVGAIGPFGVNGRDMWGLGALSERRGDQWLEWVRP